MLKGQDVVLLLRLLGGAPPASVRELAGSVGYDVGGTHRALRRLREAGLYAPNRRGVPLAPAEEFLLHGVKYVFPAQRGSETRGVPTAWAAMPLAPELARVSELPPVWPHPTGETRGIALEPLHSIVPEAALRDHALWERLALVDALRAGDARARSRRGSTAGPLAGMSLDLLERGAAALGPLLDEVVFVGGATVTLWITDRAAPASCPTRTSTLSSEVVSRAALHDFEARLRARGFAEDMSSSVLFGFLRPDVDSQARAEAILLPRLHAIAGSR